MTTLGGIERFLLDRLHDMAQHGELERRLAALLPYTTPEELESMHKAVEHERQRRVLPG